MNKISLLMFQNPWRNRRSLFPHQNAVFALMSECWAAAPADRPSSSAVALRLRALLDADAMKKEETAVEREKNQYLEMRVEYQRLRTRNMTA